MAKIGLRPYLLEIYDSLNHQQIDLSESGSGKLLFDIVQPFQSTFVAGKAASKEDRTIYLENLPAKGRSFHGFVKYGTSGVDSTITDANTGKNLFERKSAHLETLPLYYRIWIPKDGKSAIAVLQSYEKRSCATQFLNLLRDYFELNHDGYRLIAKKIMPQPAKALATAQVKKLRYYRKNVSADKVNNISLGGAESFHLELIMHARRYGGFGKLKDFVAGMEDEAGALVYDGIEFESASAQVDIGGEKRMVGLINSSNMAGVVDVSGDVEVNNGHPTPETISEEARKLIRSLRAEYGL